MLCGISHAFAWLSPTSRQIPTYYSPVRHSPSSHPKVGHAAVRLACVRRAASVQSEPGSNSFRKLSRNLIKGYAKISIKSVLKSTVCSHVLLVYIFKELKKSLPQTMRKGDHSSGSPPTVNRFILKKKVNQRTPKSIAHLLVFASKTSRPT